VPHNTTELSGKSFPEMGNMLHLGETSLGKHIDLDDAAFQFLLDPALNRIGDMRAAAMVVGHGKTARRSGAFSSNHAAASGCPAIAAAKLVEAVCTFAGDLAFQFSRHSEPRARGVTYACEGGGIPHSSI